MAAHEKKKAPPDRTILNNLSTELKGELSSSRRGEALAVMIRSLSLYLQEVGRPVKWNTRHKLKEASKLQFTGSQRKRRTTVPPIPKNAAKVVRALIELGSSDVNGSCTVWVAEALAIIDSNVDAELIGLIYKWDLFNSLQEIFRVTSRNLIVLLEAGATRSIKRIRAFGARVIPGYDDIIQRELDEIRKLHLTRLPEVSRLYMIEKDHSPERVSSVQFADPSGTVEMQQLAHLLQTSWVHFHEGLLKQEVFEEILAYCEGFKDLHVRGTAGDSVPFSDELHEGTGYVRGQDTILRIPPIVWQSGDRFKVVRKGSVSQNSLEK